MEDMVTTRRLLVFSGVVVFGCPAAAAVNVAALARADMGLAWEVILPAAGLCAPLVLWYGYVSHRPRTAAAAAGWGLVWGLVLAGYAVSPARILLMPVALLLFAEGFRAVLATRCWAPQPQS